MLADILADSILGSAQEQDFAGVKEERLSTVVVKVKGKHNMTYSRTMAIQHINCQDPDMNLAKFNRYHLLRDL